MSPCDEFNVKILRYLESDLEGRELAEFRAHLAACEDCRASVEAERALSERLHRSRPLYAAPVSLRARVSALAADSRPARARGFFGPRILAFALAVVALCLVLVPVVREARAADYVETAVSTHQSYLDGNISPELQTSSPDQVTAWLTGKVPFHFRLPNSQAVAGSVPAYHLTGASLVSYHGRPAALVTYGKENEKISVLVASSGSAVVYGGDEIRSGAITFHYQTDGGFHVITWSTHGLSYALVSSVSAAARESCMVCHQSMKDLHNFKPGQ